MKFKGFSEKPSDGIRKMTRIVGIDLDIATETQPIMVLAFAVSQKADEIVISTTNQIDEAMKLAKQAFQSGHIVRITYDKGLVSKETVWMPLKPVLNH